MKFILAILTCLTYSLAIAQTLSASANPDKILIGEPVTITYSVKTIKNHPVEFTPLVDALPARIMNPGGTLSNDNAEIEITERFTDTTKYRDNVQEWIGRYTVTVWDSGTFIINAPTVTINDSTYRFNPVKLYSNYSLDNKDIDLYDIHENFTDVPEPSFWSESVDFLKRYGWIIILFVLTLIGVKLYKVYKKKRNKEPEPIFKAMSLKERTLLAIEALDSEKKWQKNELKEHYVELSYILRSYLTSRYNVSLLERTSYETKLILTQKGLEDDTVENINRILSQSDMVKFAKSKPEELQILRISNLAKQIVVETSPLEFDNFE